MAIAVTAFLLAFVISYFVTPLIRKIALRVGFVDRPDGGRKLQSHPVSLGGGLALVIATPLAVAIIVFLMGDDAPYLLSGYPVFHSRAVRTVVALSISTAILTIVGLVDDGFGMKGSHKLLFQVLVTTLVAGMGLQVNAIQVFGFPEISLGYLGTLAAVVWMLASINSFNLIDGVDGLAGSVGVVFCLAVGTLALVRGYNMFDAILVFALAGAILGFLRYNFAPASIYLGDTGSMVIGLVLGAITLRISTKQAATVAFAVPLAIWAIPIFDSLAAVLRRKLTGRSIYATDRGHFHHVLLTRGMNPAQAVFFITALCALTSIAAVMSVVLEKPWIGIVAVAVVIGFLVFSRVFGHIEFLLLNSKILGMGQVTDSIDPTARKSTIARKRHGKWELLWDEIVSQADAYDLVKLSIHFTIPEIGEDFFATWTRSGRYHRDVTWSIDIPFVIDGVAIGRISASGRQDPDNPHAKYRDFLDRIVEIEQLVHRHVHENMNEEDPLSANETGDQDSLSGDHSATEPPDLLEPQPKTESSSSVS